MKKSIIAAGAASVALAAMPVIGVFAEQVEVLTPYDSVKDTITATVTSGCTVADSVKDKQVSISLAPGTTAESTTAGSISIRCNGVDWAVTAVGSQTGEGNSNKLVGTNGTFSPLGTSDASTWGYKVSADVIGSGITIANGVTTFHAVPAAGSAEKIATGTAATPASGTISTAYQVNALLAQPAGAYTGEVTYTVSHVTMEEQQ